MRTPSRITLTLGSLALTSMTAVAADLPQRPAYQAPAVVAPPPSWTGCYLGGNVGFAWGHGEIASTVGSLNRSGNNNGFAGGGQIGCDYQWGPMVLGVRNMLDWASLDRSAAITTGGFAGFTANIKNNWMDLLTARAGYTVTQNWLLYFQGGAAWRDSALRLFNPASGLVAESSKTKAGWTIGGGSEFKFAQNWSAFLEYNYADFGSRSATFNAPAVGGITVGAKSNVQLLLVGLNWRPF